MATVAVALVAGLVAGLVATSTTSTFYIQCLTMIKSLGNGWSKNTQKKSEKDKRRRIH